MLSRGELKGRHIGRRWYVLGSDLLMAGTEPEAVPVPEPVQVEEPKKKRRPLGHELKANGGNG
jgi:hypothetical protein